jgi:hypothetical protein
MRYLQIADPDAIKWEDTRGNSGVIRSSDTEDWAQYAAWLDEGNEPEPYRSRPALTLDQARGWASTQLNSAVDAELQPTLSKYAKVEAESWPVQLAEASQWLIDSSASTPLVDSLCDAAGKAEMCHAIIAKGAHYARLCGQVIAWRRACSAWIDASNSVDDLVSWQPIYPEVPRASH